MGHRSTMDAPIVAQQIENGPIRQPGNAQLRHAGKNLVVVERGAQFRSGFPEKPLNSLSLLLAFLLLLVLSDVAQESDKERTSLVGRDRVDGHLHRDLPAVGA